MAVVPPALFRTASKSVLLKPARLFNTRFAYTSRMAMSCSRGMLAAALRNVDPHRPSTWEFSAFSQNGEDGITDHLLSLVVSPNHYFVEIGASDGLENNTAYLAFVKKYDGLMVEGDRIKSGDAEHFLQSMNWSVRYLNLFVEPENTADILRASRCADPDFFSLDIDSNDFYVAEALLSSGFRPKIMCVEYNSAFGPTKSVAIPYTQGLDYKTFHPSGLYYGVSIQGWRSLLEGCGYRFVSTDRRGVNAFFVRPEALTLPDELESTSFAENTTQYVRHGGGWEVQLAQIADLPVQELPPADQRESNDSSVRS